MVVMVNTKVKKLSTMVTEKKQIFSVQMIWNNTPNFNGDTSGMVVNLKKICGENVYGKKRGKDIIANELVIDYLERSTKMDIFKCVEGGDIISAPPSKEYFILKLVGLGLRALKYYSSLPYEKMVVKDNWYKDAQVNIGEPMNKYISAQSRVLKRSGKRFSSEVITVKETVIDMIKSSSGMLAEGHVIAFLNSGLKCPQCDTLGNIGWCDGVSKYSVDSFRDAVCMNCLGNGVVTLFEIKTRWERVVASGGNSTYAGSFVALNTLMAINANVYLVLVSRDTGDVRIGKITSAKMRGNHNWLYALQEGFKWGGPASYVTCSEGLFHIPDKMRPLLKTLPKRLVKEITESALKKMENFPK